VPRGEPRNRSPRGKGRARAGSWAVEPVESPEFWSRPGRATLLAGVAVLLFSLVLWNLAVSGLTTTCVPARCPSGSSNCSAPAPCDQRYPTVQPILYAFAGLLTLVGVVLAARGALRWRGVREDRRRRVAG
jgi:hypothetical protein